MNLKQAGRPSNLLIYRTRRPQTPAEAPTPRTHTHTATHTITNKIMSDLDNAKWVEKQGGMQLTETPNASSPGVHLPTRGHPQPRQARLYERTHVIATRMVTQNDERHKR